MHVSFELMFLYTYNKHPEVKLLDHITDAILVFFFRNVYTVFCSACTDLQSHRQCLRLLFSSHPCEHIHLVFLVRGILTSMGWYVIIIGLNCICLVINDVWNLFILTLCVSSLETCLLRSTAQFSIQLFGCVFCSWFGWVLYIFCILIPYQISGTFRCSSWI